MGDYGMTDKETLIEARKLYGKKAYVSSWDGHYQYCCVGYLLNGFIYITGEGKQYEDALKTAIIKKYFIGKIKDEKKRSLLIRDSVTFMGDKNGWIDSKSYIKFGKTRKGKILLKQRIIQCKQYLRKLIKE